MRTVVALFIVISLLPVCGLATFAAEGNTTGCVLLERQGKVEFARKGSAAWTLAKTGEVLQVGDRIRTGLRARATLRWSELAVIRVDELTSMEIQPPAKPGAKPEMELKSGASYFFSREKPADIQFRTPVTSGAIRGTEFNLRVAEDGRTELALLHGEVALANAQGDATLKSGELGMVAPGSAPTKTALIDAVSVIQWVMYYPAVVDVDEVGLSEEEKRELAGSLEAYRAGDLLAALEKYPEGRVAGSDADRLLHASLLLAAGQPGQAEETLQKLSAASPVANAVREVVATVKGREVSSPAEPTTASEWLARSYQHQSRGKLAAAREAAREATTKSPGFGAAWIRLAELEFGFGRPAAASAGLVKGRALSPRNAQGLALDGFILAAQNRTSEAMESFNKAIATDGALANAWLGRGLLKIRRNRDVVKFLPDRYRQGLEDLQVAATLEPQRAVLRSYLGKAFSEAHDLPRARKELDLAKQIDPNDPTSWLYSALLNQADNRVNEAVSDLEKSKELNGNRSLFRSQLLLDKDDAVRGANLAAMYRDVGMFDRSVQEASRAVNSDYANYSAHLFLANSYDTLRDPKLINLRYETPWFSELLVANLLAPVGGGNLSQSISQQEYSRFFVSDGLGIFSSTEYRSGGDWIQNVSQYGQFGNTSYSFDSSYRTENGDRPNNDLEQLNLALRLKQQITDTDSVFFQVGYFDSESGDVAQHYDQASGSTTFRAKEKQEPSLLLGWHREWSPGNHTLFLFSRFDDQLALNDSNAGPLARTTYTFIDPGGNTVTNDFLSNPNNTALGYQSDLEAYSAELQQIWQTPQQMLVAGVRYQAAWADTASTLDRPGFGPFGVPISVAQSISSELDRFSIYGYEYWKVCDTLSLIGGVSYDRLHYPRNIDISPLTSDEATKDQISPKGGILWTPWKDANVRAAYSRSLGGVFFDQSVRLEPVQLAGFNQTFRSVIPESVAGLVPGTRFETWGAGFDQRFKETGTYLLLQGEILNSDATRTLGILTNDVAGDPFTPGNPSSTRQTLDFEEKSFVAVVNQLVGREVSVGVRYKLTDADLTTHSPDIPATIPGAWRLNQDVSATLHQVWLYAIYQHRGGFFTQFDTVWSQQSNRGYTPDIPGDDFWQFNVYAGYRFLQRRGEVRVGLLNIGNEDYRLNPLTLYNELPRERTLMVSLKLDF